MRPTQKKLSTPLKTPKNTENKLFLAQKCTSTHEKVSYIHLYYTANLPQSQPKTTKNFQNGNIFLHTAAYLYLKSHKVINPTLTDTYIYAIFEI